MRVLAGVGRRRCVGSVQMQPGNDPSAWPGTIPFSSALKSPGACAWESQKFVNHEREMATINGALNHIDPAIDNYPARGLRRFRARAKNRSPISFRSGMIIQPAVGRQSFSLPVAVPVRYQCANLFLISPHGPVNKFKIKRHDRIDHYAGG